MTNTIRVSSATELMKALANAQGGETILLAGGDYGSVTMRSTGGLNLGFTSEVSIVSEDPANPAVFTGMFVKGASNLTFDGIVFDYTYASTDELFSRPFQVVSSDNIAIQNSVFDGDAAQGRSALDDGLGFAIGLSVRNIDTVTLDNNTFHNFYRGMVVQEVQNALVTGNELYGLRMDGMNFGDVQGVQITDNYIHDFQGSTNPADHRDMIQFWTNGTKQASSDIVIANNRLDIGDGDYTQSIFMRNDQVDRGLAGYEMYYQNVTIQDNLIINGHMHGITVGETDGLTISNNTVVHSDGSNPDGQDGGVEVPQIRVASTSMNVKIAQNITSTITGDTGRSDWTLDRNVFVQDQDAHASGYYKDVFFLSSLDGATDAPAYLALPGSEVETAGAGAPQAITALEQASQFHVVADANDPSFLQFTADLTGNLPAGTQFTWLLSDGTTANGQTITHKFQAGGHYDAQLIITLPDGTQLTEAGTVDVPDLTILSLQSDGSFIATEFGSLNAIAAQSPASGGGMALGGSGPVAKVAREHVQDILNEDSFEIAFDLTANSGATSGDLFRIHSVLTASVTRDGMLTIVAYSQDGVAYTVKSAGSLMTDGAAHSIALRYAGDTLELWVDGAVADSTAMVEPLAATGNHDLVFGNPWSSSNFDSTLDSFNISLVPGAGQTVTTPSFQAPTSPTPVPTVVTQQAVQTPTVATPATPVVTPTDTGTDTSTGADTGADAGPASPPQPAPVQDSSTILSLLSNGQFLAEDNGAGVMMAGGDPTGIDLTGKGAAASVDRGHVADILGSDEFEISLTLQADGSDSPRLGDVFRLQGSMIVQVRENGDMLIRAFASDGSVARVATKGLDVNDTASHDVTLRYGDGLFQVWVDGALVGDMEMSAPLADTGNHDLVFGNPWSGSNFAGSVQSFDVSLSASTVLADGTLEVVEDTFEQLYAATGGLYQGSVEWVEETASTPDDASGLVDDIIYDAPILHDDALSI